MSKSFLKFLAVVFWIFVWWIIAIIVDSFIIPSPSETLNALYNIIISNGFIKVLGASLFRILLGFLISTILGIVIGIFAGLNEKFEIFINPIISVIKSVPVISLILIILFWVKSSNVPLVVCFLMCLPVMYNNVLEGLKNVDNKLLEMGKLYKMNNRDLVKKIYIHSIKPYIFSATKTCLNLGFRVTVAAEVLSSPKYGLGTKLFDSKVYLSMDNLFAYTLIIILFSYLFEILLKYIIDKNTIKGVYIDARN